MKIGMIGAGKVGTSMAKYIADHGGTVVGFFSRTESSGQESAQFTGTKYFTALEALVEESDTLFIATTDEAIRKVWDCIAAGNIQGKVICHFSGSLSSDVFSDWEETGAWVCSIHPIYAFSNKFTAYKNLTGAKFAVEGSGKALAKLQPLFALLPNEIVRISTENKVKYHAATSIASNHVVGLIYLAVELLKDSGIAEPAAYRLLQPLVEKNVEAVFCQNCVQALTGPIERNDLATVKRHLDKLKKPEWEEAYRAVGSQVAQVAKKKHPERKFEEMEQLLARQEASREVAG